MEVKQLESRLKQLAETCSKAKPHDIDLGGIYRETRDLENAAVRKTVEDLYENYYTHGTDTTQWRFLNKSKRLNPSAADPSNTAIFHRHFIKELETGRYIVNGKIPVHCRITFFVKDEGDGKFRFIPDYSDPKNGTSVNSLVPENAGRVELNDKLELIQFAFDNGRTTHLAKNDSKSWYRQIPMARRDWSISVYHWCGIDFVDTRMPWGSVRASKIAHHLSIAITHIAYKYIPRYLKPCWFNYIDDHIARAPNAIACLYIHVVYIFVCTKYGIQLNLKKTILVATKLVGLGIMLDVQLYEASVTTKRQIHITKHLLQLQSKRRATAKYGQSVAGKCEDVAFMLYPLRVYLRYLRREIPDYEDPDQTFRITPEIRNMCAQWIRALKYLKGRKMERIITLPLSHPHPCYTDASNIGYGAIYKSHWVFGKFFPDEVQSGKTNNICERELYPVLIMGMLFGPHWTGTQVLLKIDNQNACEAIINKDIRNVTAHTLLVRICEVMMQYRFEFRVDYIPTQENIFADALSRLEIQRFKALSDSKEIKIDPSPMIHPRPPFEIGKIHHTHFPNIEWEQNPFK